MNKICTSIEQSKKLMELGIDVNTADMTYRPIMDIDSMSNSGFLDIPDCYPFNEFKDCYIKPLPCWSLSALLDLMPKIHGERPKLDAGRIQTEKYYVEYPYHERTKDDWYSTKLCDSAVDAAFEMIVWLFENGLIKTE